jgi:hypothetical protein
MARCCREKASFGIRYEEINRDVWAGTWAFPIKESSTFKENYEKNSINGSVVLNPEYPGCPYCKSKGIFLCGECNRVACYDTESKFVICPHCNIKLKLSDRIHHLDAGGDR